MPSILPPMLLAAIDGIGPALAIGGVGLVVGWIGLWRASAASRRGWIYRRAPRLPIDVLSDHDDAWIEGTVEASEPLICPRFEVPCASYRYTIEREVEESSEDDDGNRTTSTTWETVHSEHEVIPFELTSEFGAITVDLPSAKSVETEAESDREWDMRYRAHIVPIGKQVSVLGVKLEDNTFGPYREVPLVVSMREHEKLMRSAERGEGRRRWFALIFSFVALGLAVFVYGRNAGSTHALGSYLTASAIALGVWIPLWWMSTYNRFIRQREQVHAAWRQIDVDLAVRNSLLPNFQQVVSSYAEHEQSLQAKLAELRNEMLRPDVKSDIASHGRRETDEDQADVRAETDRMTTETVRSLFALVENYPDLKANEMFADLHRRLWALEEKLSASRDFYNGCAKQWNQLVQGFPSGLVAKVSGHETRPYFEG